MLFLNMVSEMFLLHQLHNLLPCHPTISIICSKPFLIAVFMFFSFSLFSFSIFLCNCHSIVIRFQQFQYICFFHSTAQRQRVSGPVQSQKPASHFILDMVLKARCEMAVKFVELNERRRDYDTSVMYMSQFFFLLHEYVRARLQDMETEHYIRGYVQGLPWYCTARRMSACITYPVGCLWVSKSP